MSWTIRPVVKDNTLVEIELVECLCSEVKLGEVVFSDKEEALNHFGSYWDAKWKNYKDWEKVYKGYIDPVKATLYLQEQLEEKDRIEQQLRRTIFELQDNIQERADIEFQNNVGELATKKYVDNKIRKELERWGVISCV